MGPLLTIIFFDPNIARYEHESRDITLNLEICEIEHITLAKAYGYQKFSDDIFRLEIIHTYHKGSMRQSVSFFSSNYEELSILKEMIIEILKLRILDLCDNKTTYVSPYY